MLSCQLGIAIIFFQHLRIVSALRGLDMGGRGCFKKNSSLRISTEMTFYTENL